MAISVSRLKQKGAKQATARRLAKEYEAQQAKESKRKGWSSLLGGVGGKLLGTALAGMTGGLAAPLLMAAGTFGGKTLAHQLTKGMGADTSGLKAGKYGYGGEEAKTLREGLEQQLRESDPWKQRGGFGRDLLGAYVGAGMAGKLGGAKDFLKGGKGAPKFGEALFGKDGWKSEGWKEALFGKAAAPTELTGEELEASSFIPDGGGAMDTLMKPETFTTGEHGDVIGEEGWSELGFAQGGLVPQSRTIADYFGKQGLSLGGSNKQSLSQILGR